MTSQYHSTDFPDDEAYWQVQLANDPGYLAAMARYAGPPIKEAKILSALDRLKSQVARLSRRAGKKAQAFTQRQIQRARRAAPDCAIIIRQSGDLELLPPGGKPDATDVNPWDGEERKLRQERE